MSPATLFTVPPRYHAIRDVPLPTPVSLQNNTLSVLVGCRGNCIYIATTTNQEQRYIRQKKKNSAEMTYEMTLSVS
jgi:hypothetical protein